jgi:hypothetical protein
MRNNDRAICLDPTVRVEVEEQLLEFEDLRMLLAAVRDDLLDDPERFRSQEYAMATGVSVGEVVDRLDKLEGQVRDYVTQWMDLRAMIGECDHPIRRRQP